MTAPVTGFVVSICGPSGAGKSTVAKAVTAVLGSTRCVRIPGDVFLVPACGSLAVYWQRPLTYDWAALAQVLAAPNSTVVGMPDFDFDRFARVSMTGGRQLTMRPVRVIDTLRLYPAADLTVRLSAPPAIRRARIIGRDAVWGSHVIDRWAALERTHTADAGRSIDLDLDGCDDPIHNATTIAAAIDRAMVCGQCHCAS